MKKNYIVPNIKVREIESETPFCFSGGEGETETQSTESTKETQVTDPNDIYSKYNAWGSDED